MLAFYSLPGSQVPIVILKNRCDGAMELPSDRIVQLIAEYYGSDILSRNYLKIKVQPYSFENGLPRELIVYRLLRDKYHYETDRLFVDESFSVLREEKNIQI